MSRTSTQCVPIKLAVNFSSTSKMPMSSSNCTICPVQQDFETLDIEDCPETLDSEGGPCAAPNLSSAVVDDQDRLLEVDCNSCCTEETKLGAGAPKVAENGSDSTVNVFNTTTQPVSTEPTRLLRPSGGLRPGPKRFFRSFWRGITMRAVAYDKHMRITGACSDE